MPIMSGYTWPIVTKFSETVDILLQINGLTYSFRRLKGRCHSNQFFCRKCETCHTAPLFTAFHNGHCKTDGRINSDDPSTLYRNLVRFGLVNYDVRVCFRGGGGANRWKLTLTHQISQNVLIQDQRKPSNERRALYVYQACRWCSSSRFPFRARTHMQRRTQTPTQSQTPLIPLSTVWLSPAWLTITCRL